jgi:3alpha(or 20beta)-hydroxysteroid dehydrogenase
MLEARPRSVISANQVGSVIEIDLSGKVALVTGAARGIGAAIADIFAGSGVKVLLTDVLEPDGVEAARRITKRGQAAAFARHDVGVEADWEGAIAKAIRDFGGLDIVVNNAGIEQTVYLSEVVLADVQRLMSVNVIGTILGHKHAIRAMRPGGPSGRGGVIINLSSVAGLIGTPGLGVYSASKGAVRMLSKAAAVECGRLGYGIRVNSIHPGLIKTKMGDKLVDDFVALGILPETEPSDAILSTYPIGRTGVPLDVARTALFLASDLSSWTTGAEFVVDGGMTVA